MANISTKPNGEHAKHSSAEILATHEASNLEKTKLGHNFQHLKDMAPNLGRLVTEHMFGQLTANSLLNYREWALMALTALIVMGDTSDQLQVYVLAALQQGATTGEIQDAFAHAAAYCGAPRAVTATRRIQHLLPECPYKERVVHLSDHSTIVRDTGGSGVPIVLIHALCMDGRMWEDVFPKLSTSCRVIAYDTRGHGFARAAPLTQSMEHLADDLSQLLNTLGIEKADIYGQSYGGVVAQYFGLRYPQQTRSLALITTSAESQSEEWTARATRAEEHGMEHVIPASIIRWFSPEAVARNPWYVRYARMCLERARVQDWAAAWRAMARLDCMDRGKEYGGPVLALCGKQDASVGPAVMRKTAAAWNADYVELDPGTHMMGMEQAANMVECLVAFRTKVDSQSIVP